MEKERIDLPLAGILIDRSGYDPLYCQLYKSLKNMILEGRLVPGQTLPATRLLASELGVSRNTVLLAYDYLLTEGYVQGKAGSGTYVSRSLPENALQAVPEAWESEPLQATPACQLSCRGRSIAGIAINIEPHPRKIQPFQNGLPDIREFPFNIWKRLVNRQWQKLANEYLGYSDPRGYWPLRQAISDYLRTARAVNCESKQVIIVSGTQQALDLAARLLLDPGDSVWMEDPGYFGARAAFLAAEAKLIPVPTDEDGLDIEAAMSIKPCARMAYVTPSFQFPIGATMSLARRCQLLEWAKESDAWILEDDYDSEYRYIGHPQASLQGLDNQNRVIYLGTFSKVMFPGLRLGYLVVPLDLVDAFASARAIAGRNSPIIEQAALAEFINEGHFARHIRRMRVLYHKRQQMLIEAVAQNGLSNILDLETPEAGMQLIAWLPQTMDDERISNLAKESGLTTAPVSTYGMRYKKRPGLILGYTAFRKNEIEEGLERLKRILR